MEGVPEFCTYVPGADAGLNESRRQPVRAVTIHRTEGTDSRGLGEHRHHHTPGTFQFLVRDEACYCYYPAWVRCSHAAGANKAGPGIEIEGFTGQPLSAAQLDRLAQLVRWLSATYQVPLVYKTGDPRDYVDVSGYRGFVAHRAVDYPPDRSLLHYDEIPYSEWALVTLPSPSPVPVAHKEPDSMLLSSDNITWYLVTPNGKAVLLADNNLHKDGQAAVYELAVSGVPHTQHMPLAALTAIVNA